MRLDPCGERGDDLLGPSFLQDDLGEVPGVTLGRLQRGEKLVNAGVLQVGLRDERAILGGDSPDAARACGRGGGRGNRPRRAG